MSDVDFGYKKVKAEEKDALVGDVFNRVAQRYDIMNDLMSLGTHRLFKQMVVQLSGVREGHTILDLAGGTGDMSALFGVEVGQDGLVVLTDPNPEMLSVGRERLWDKGMANVQFCRSPGEHLPFPDQTFDAACISFGLRNFTDKDAALKEILRCLKPGAALVVLEFSTPEVPLVKQAYEAFQNPLANCRSSDRW